MRWDFLEYNFASNHVGLVIQDLKNNKIIYQHNAHKLFIPASLVKLFTLATSLEGLSANFKFITSVKWDPKTLKHKQNIQNNWFDQNVQNFVFDQNI